jgi:TonB-dependent starch-binding outer membrane protein SusC
MTKLYQNLARTMLAFMVLCLVSSQAWSQARAVTGTLTSADDDSPLPGANIVEKGTTNGTVSDANGSFSITAKQNATLVISFIGYETQEIILENQTAINIKLKPDAALLSEVVIVGYGKMEAKDVTGAVVSISTKDFNRGVTTSPQDLLVGKLAGVQITSGSGAPGSNSTIRIRGGSSLNASNDPLIVIDGFPVDNTSVGGVSNPLAAINPADIESYTVLKDASATAIYGSRASNGVIIITTKKGQEGKPKFTYNANVSLSSPIKYFDVLSADEYRALATQAAEEGKGGLNTGALSTLGSANTNWQREIYRNAISHDHNLTAAGAVKNFPYRLSYGYTDQQGILKNTDLKRNSLNINLTPSFFDNHLKLNASAKGSIVHNNFGNDGAVGSAISFDPTQPIHDGNTDWGGYFTWRTPDNLPNPIATNNPVALIEQTNNKSTVQRLIGNLQAEYKFHFLPALKFNVNTGFDITKSDGHNNSPSNAAFTYRGGTGRLDDYDAKNHSELFDMYINYTKDMRGSKIDFTAGYSWQHFRRQSSDFNRNGDGTIVATQVINRNENFLVSFFGRLNYSYKDKYLLTATLRDDGSSRFAKENRWGLFPALSVAWRLSEESFINSSALISNLKIRAGYGVTGQQDIGGMYPSLATYQVSQTSAQYQFGSVLYKTIRPNAYDANIKWESTTTLNAGLDFGFLNDKISGSIEVYKRETTDLLSTVPIPLGSNFSNFLTTNVGSLQNRGVEFQLNTVPVSKGKFIWNAGFNLTYNTNKITKISLTDNPTYTGVNTTFVGNGNYVGNYNIGAASSSFFVYEQVYDESGKPIEGIYVDQTGKGGNIVSSDLNRIRYKQWAPVTFMGVNSRITYGKFDFAFSGRINLGNYVYNGNWANRATYGALYNQSGYFSNVPSAITDAQFINTQSASSYYIQDASFFKMDNMNLGYNLEQLFTQKIKARVSLTVRNAFIITKYSGIDPEVDGGVDNGVYPRPRTFVLGFNFNF